MATAREILAGRAAVELSLRDKLKAGLDAAQGRLQRFAINVAAIGISFSTVSAMASRAMGIIGNVFTGPADQLQNLTDRTGLSVEMLQTLAEAGGDAGATLEDVGGAARSMANFLQQVERGGDGAEKTLADLGVSADDLKNATQDQRLAMFSDALAGIADPARRAALAQDVFGRGAMNLLPVLGQGSGALDAYRKRLDETGGLKTAEQIAAADDLGDAFGRLSRRIKGAGFSALSAMSPVLQKIADAAVGLVEAFNQFIVANPMLAQAIGVVVISAIGATVALAVLTSGVLAASAVASAATVAWGVLTAAVGAFSAVAGIVMSPLGLIVAGIAVAVLAIGGLVVAFATLTESGQVMTANLMTSLSNLWARVTQTMGGIFDAIATGNLALAGEIAMAGLVLAWTVGWGNIKTVSMNAIAAIGGLLVDGIAFAIGLTATKIDLLIMAWNKLAETIDGTKIDFSAKSLVEGAAESAKAALEDAAKATADEVRQGVEDAGAALDKLTKQAEDAKKKRDAALTTPPVPEGGDGGGEPAKDIAKAVAEKVGQGTFSAAVAGRMGMSNRGEQATIETADNTREMARIFADINRKFDEGKLVVAE